MAWETLLAEARTCVVDSRYFDGVKKINLCMELFESGVSDNSNALLLKDPQAFAQAMLPKLSETQKAALAQMHEVRGDILLGLGASRRALLEFTCASTMDSLGNASEKMRKVEERLRKLSNKVPCTILIGCRGSGKTTLANRILVSQLCKRIAVIENEFGEVGIDQALAQHVMSPEENIISGGCTCNTVRGDLIRCLKYLEKKSRAESKPLDRILIETSSLADPVPLVQTFLADDFVRTKYSLDGIVMLVNAQEISQRLNEHKAGGFEDEAAKQLAFADRILINKTDLIDEEMLVRVENHIRLINPSVPVKRALHSDIDIKYILDIDAWSLDNVLNTEDRICFNNASHKVITCHLLEDSVHCFNMAGQEVFSIQVPPGEEPFGPWLWRAAQEQIVKGRLHLVKANGEDIWVQEHASSVGIDISGEVDKEKFNQWIVGLTRDPDINLFRFKGILAVQGQKAPFMFQGLDSQFTGSEHTERIWKADEQRGCKILLMGNNLNMDKLVGSFTQCMVEHSQQDADSAWVSDLSGIASRLSVLFFGKSN